MYIKDIKAKYAQSHTRQNTSFIHVRKCFGQIQSQTANIIMYNTECLVNGLHVMWTMKNELKVNEQYQNTYFCSLLKSGSTR